MKKKIATALTLSLLAMSFVSFSFAKNSKISASKFTTQSTKAWAE